MNTSIYIYIYIFGGEGGGDTYIILHILINATGFIGYNGTIVLHMCERSFMAAILKSTFKAIDKDGIGFLQVNPGVQVSRHSISQFALNDPHKHGR